MTDTAAPLSYRGDVPDPEPLSLLTPTSDAAAVLEPTAGQVRASDPVTSKASAARASLKAGKLKHRILRALAMAGDEGMNDYQLWRYCDPKGRAHSAATRRKELGALGMVRTTARTHPTDSGIGLVHVITDAGRAALAELAELADATGD